MITGIVPPSPRGKAFGVVKENMKYNGNRQLTPLAQNLRRNMTREEKHLWYDFLKSHPENFRRQKVKGDYILDFYSHQVKLAVELDGEQHYDDLREKDEKRTAYLNSLGISVLRFSNDEIRNDFDATCEQINLFIQKLKFYRTVINESPLDRHS